MYRLVTFKNFTNAELDLLNPFTLLIGKNGSGKSNAIEGIELLSRIAQGTPIYEIADIGRGTAFFSVRGGLQGCPQAGGSRFELEFSARIRFKKKAQSFKYRVGVGIDPNPAIIEENLIVGDRRIFHAGSANRRRTKRTIKVYYDNFKSGPNPSTSLPTDRSILSQYEDFAPKNNRQKDAANLVRSVRKYLKSSFVFDPQPKLMRGYERIGQRVLTRDGANISAVLAALADGTEDEKKALQRILGWITQVPEEPFHSFFFEKTDLGDVLLGFRSDSDQIVADTRTLSDGTLRCLAVLVALETVEKGSRLVIEELDNGIHPSRVKVITDAVQNCANRRKLNVLCTTHNPATLNALSYEQLEGVAVCVHDHHENAGRIIPLLDLPRADLLLERGSIGDLVTREILERHLEPDFEKRQRELAHHWVESVQ